MKTIRNIHDLRLQQKEVEQRRIELEKELQHDWNDIRSFFVNEGNSFFRSERKKIASRIVSKGISFGAGLIARKFGEKIGNKIYGWFK